MYVAASLYFISSILSDAFGRMRTFMAFTIPICIFSFATYFIPDITWKVVGFAIVTAEEAILCGLFTYIINETCSTTSKLRSAGIAFYFCIFTFGGIIVSLLTYVITDPDTLYLIMVIATAVCALPSFFLVYEPPKQLYRRGRVSELFRVLLKIGHRNGKTDITMQQLQNEAELTEIDLEQCKCILETKTTAKEKFRMAVEQ